MSPRPAAPRRGFTLVELLVALGVMSMMLLALFTFVFSMGEIWGRGSDQRLFEQHVNASARHVESLLRRGTAPLPGVSATDTPYSVRSVRGVDSFTADLLTFNLPEGDRLMNWPGSSLPDVVCSLGVVSGRGLMLYWQSALETNADTEPPRAATISPFVTKLEFLTYQEDTNSWRTETTMRKGTDGKWIAPDRLRLTYTSGSLNATRDIALPLRAGGVPAY